MRMTSFSTGVMEEEKEVDDGSDELRHNQQQIKYDALKSQIAERTMMKDDDVVYIAKKAGYAWHRTFECSHATVPVSYAQAVQRFTPCKKCT